MKLDRRLLTLLESHRLLLFLAVLAGLLGGILVVVQARTLSSIINSVFRFQASLTDVSYLLNILLLVILARGLMIWGGQVVGHCLAVKIKLSLREELYKHIYRLGPGYLRTRLESGTSRSGELVQILNQGVEALEAYYSQYLPQLALSVLVPLTILLFIIPVDRLSGLVLILLAPLIPLFMVLIGDRADELTKRQWSSLKWMSSYFLDVLQGLSTLKVFGRSKDQVEIIARIGEKYRRTTMGVLRVTFLSALALEWLAMLSTAVVAVEIGLRLLYGRLDFEQAFFVLLLTPEFYLPLRLLGAKFHAGMAGVAAAASIFEILESHPDQNISKVESSQSFHLTNSFHPDPVSIEFKQVHFRFSDEETVLEDISFLLPAGKVTALVGPSGAGKSTIADLLLRFIRPQEGEIFINNFPIMTIPEDAYLSQVSWVSQNPYLFNASVAENIRLARPDANLDEVKLAAKDAQAHEFVSQLPQGYNTQIGERGTRLSAGQVQRIAIARAFLKQSPLLILDEATANLDPGGADKINSAMSALMVGRTVIVIAHNLKTIQNADQIIFLDRGRIVEVGTHSQLMDQHGPYWRMVTGDASEQPPVTLPPFQSPKTRIVELPNLSPTGAPGIYSFSSLRTLLSNLAEYKWLVILSVLLGWATVLSGMGLLATAAYLISEASIVPSIAFLQVPIVGVRFFGLARGIFRYLERNISHNTTLHLVTRLRVWFYRQIEPLAPSRLMQHRSGDLLSRIHNDLNSLEDFYVRVVSPPIIWLGVTLTASILLGLFSIQLGIILLGFQILAGLVTPILVRNASRNSERELLDEQGRLAAELVDGIQGLAELKVFDAAKSQQHCINQINQRIGNIQFHQGKISGFESSIESILAHLAAWAVLFAAIPFVTRGLIDGVFLGTLLFIALASFEATQPLPKAVQSLESGLASASRLDEILTTQPEVIDPEKPIPAPARLNLEVENLSFSYSLSPNDQSDSLVLDQINLHLEPGTHYAIVGPSGGGKTTFANILLRFWEYHHGRIQLGGFDLSAYRQDDIRALISFTSQRPHIFNATLRENLLIANPDAREEEIQRACQTAQINDLIEHLPQNFDTRLGEGGLRLSAGERQRVAIARALLKDAPIAIFDEPTANLDPEVERKLVEALFSHLADKTTLWLTHRLFGMEIMDEIFVLNEGKIVERGQHSQLMQLGGLYRQLWDLQHQVF